jgi:hypothetical protein
MPELLDLDPLLDRQHGMVSVEQLRAFGVTDAMLRTRLRREWRLILPRVVDTRRGDRAPIALLTAAALYAGAGAVITSSAAAAWHGVTAAAWERRVHVEVPVPRNPRGAAFVVVRRTRRPDERAWSRNGLLIASPARAVMSAAADAGSDDRCRAVLIEAVQRGVATPAQLRHELECAPRRGSARPRAALREVEDRAWSVPEADLLRVLGTSTVLPAVWANPDLRAADGTRLPRPDGWVDDVALAVQVHSWQFHSAAHDWEHTVMADGVYAEHGVVVVAVTPAAIERHPEAVLHRVERAYLAARGRPRPAVTATRHVGC